jgi:hypothetical protein
MAGLQRITRQNLADHRVTVPGMVDESYAPLYDFVNYPAAGATSLNLFALPQGQGVTTAPGGAGGTKTEADTNLTNAGMLPSDQSFYMTGIEIMVFPGINPGRGGVADATAGQFWNDLYAIGKSGWLRLRVGTRDYIVDGPLMIFPTTQGLGGVAAVCTDLTAGAATFSEIEYARFVGQPYTLVPLFITPTQNFGVQLNWPGLVPTVSTTIARIGCRLRGRFMRAAQ